MSSERSKEMRTDFHVDISSPFQDFMIVHLTQALEAKPPPPTCHIMYLAYRKLTSSSRSLKPTMTHFLIKVRGETTMEADGGPCCFSYCTLRDPSWFLPVRRALYNNEKHQWPREMCTHTSIQVGKCSTTREHTDTESDTQTQTLQGLHRSASHKPHSDVRWQLCAQSRLFSALPSGHVGSQNPQQSIREHLSNWRLGGKESQYSHSFLCHTSQFKKTICSKRTGLQSCDLIYHMRNAIFTLITHDYNLILAPLTGCFMLSDPWGNYSILTNTVYLVLLKLLNIQESGRIVSVTFTPLLSSQR